MIKDATRRGPHPLAAGICTVLGTLPMLWLVNANVAALPALTVVFAFLSGALSGTVGPNMRCGALAVCCLLGSGDGTFMVGRLGNWDEVVLGTRWNSMQPVAVHPTMR